MHIYYLLQTKYKVEYMWFLKKKTQQTKSTDSPLPKTKQPTPNHLK